MVCRSPSSELVGEPKVFRMASSTLITVRRTPGDLGDLAMHDRHQLGGGLGRHGDADAELADGGGIGHGADMHQAALDQRGQPVADGSLGDVADAIGDLGRRGAPVIAEDLDDR